MRLAPRSTAAMQLQVSDVAGPFNIDVSYSLCASSSSFFICDRYQVLATLRVTGVAVN